MERKLVATYLSEQELKMIEKASLIDNRSISNFLKISSVNRAKKILEIAEPDFDASEVIEEQELEEQDAEEVAE